MKVLVIPSNREACLKEFLAAWEGGGGWDRVIVIEDAPKRSFDFPRDESLINYAWDDIEGLCGKDAWIFSKRDSAIRCFGLWKAWQMGAEYVLTLDDDCFPIENNDLFFTDHIYGMNSIPKWVDSALMRTRGIPYRNLGELDSVKANIGLWTKHPDFDAVQSLMNNDCQIPMMGQRIIPQGQYFPVCGMNLCIKREAIPLFYFPLMGQGQPYSRFDDIWAGIIAKKVMDHLGWQMSVGEPFVEHRKASDPFVNLVKEAPGIGANEKFWEVIDRITLPDSGSGYKNPIVCMNCIGRDLQDQPNDYLAKLGKAIRTWTNLFQENS